MDPFLAQLADLCRANPTRAKWVLVYSHALGHTLGERLAREGASWVNLRFRTPFDLALETAAPGLVERAINPVAEDIGPALIMRLLMDLPPSIPEYLRPLAAHVETGAALWSSIRELRLAGVRAADLKVSAFRNPRKHAELRALVSAYEAYLEANRLADAAAVYADARLHVASSPVTPEDVILERSDVVWPPLVRAFIDALPGERAIPAAPRIPGLAVPPRLRDQPRNERDITTLLAFLIQPTEAPGPADPDRIQMFRAGGRDAEVEEVFRRVLGSDDPPRLDAVEIACASPDHVLLAWERARRDGLPVTVAPGVPVVVARPARALLGWCEWVESGFVAARLRRLLLSGDMRLELDGGPARSEAARFLGGAKTTWGLATYTSSLLAHAASWRTRADDPETDDDARDRYRERAERIERFRIWVEAALSRVPTVTNGHVPMRALIAAAKEFVTDHGAIGDEFDAQALAAIDVALGQLQMLGDVGRSLSEALELIRAAVQGLSVGSERARPGHLHVSALSRTGLAGRAHTFVVGLEEGRVFPPRLEDPVLLDDERRAIHRALATSTDRLEEAVYRVVSRLVALEGRVCLSYSCRDLREHRETFPSWILLQARRLLNPAEEVSYDTLARSLGEPRSAVPLTTTAALSDHGWWLNRLVRAGTTGVEPVLAAFPSLRQGRTAEAARDSVDMTVYDGFVANAGPVLDPRESGQPVSATRLESLAECPYRYFVQYGLGLEPIEESEPDDDVWLDALTRGSLLHALYAEVMRELARRKEAPDLGKHGEWARCWADARLTALRAELPPPSAVVFERERQQILDDISVFLDVDARRIRGKLTPLALEVSFGRAEEEGEERDPLACPDPVALDVVGVRFKLRGRIDRIDRAKDGRYLVVDYKTGRLYRKNYAGTFRGGRMLQHALYGLAAVELLKPIEPSAKVAGGIYYFPSARGGGQVREIKQPPIAKTAEVLTDLFDTLRNGAFLSTDAESDCKFCKFGSVCGGKPRASAAAKLQNTTVAALEPFRRLRQHE